DTGPGAAQRFAEVSGSPPLLRAFLYRMPKGGDLHVHLSGAAYAEPNLRAGAAAGRCANLNSGQVSQPPCAKGTDNLAKMVDKADPVRALVDAWSMRNFVPSSGYSGHDHFFGTFSRFGGVADPPDMAAEVIDRAGRQRMRYIELMITFQGHAVAALADSVNATRPWTGDMAAFQADLMAAGLTGLVQRAVQDVQALDQQFRRIQRCDTAAASPGCGVTVRWLAQVTRTAPPWRVFAQTLFAALLQRAHPHVVGLNFVAPEDDPVALADYTAQMRMLDHVFHAHPDTAVALHAGELTLGLVPPEDLTFHIRQAVALGHARRIGHGVSVMYETDAFDLLREMARRRVAVEINLTSNAQILRVAGADHPFPVFRAAGVPTVISTDDEGVERIDRTHELQRAATSYGLGWTDLVELERNTLEYAFVAGASLWADPVRWRMVPACDGASPAAEPLPACAAFLDGSEKARLQWALERDLIAFDREAAGMRLGPP
ncbi:MAG: adenosine deaminase, partial [Acetobacteraceae bacterium]